MKKLLLLSALTIVFVNVLFSQNVPSYVPTNGLVGYWPFNGNANDESGNGNHGTVNGAKLTADRNGKANSAYSFDGVSNNIKCTNSGPTGNPTFSISFWIKSSQTTYGHLIGYGNNGVSGQDFRIFINGNCNNSIAFDTYDNQKANSTSFNNLWDFYAVTYDGKIGNNTSIVKIYKNGVLTSSECFNVNISNTNISKLIPITFGRYHGTVQNGYYNGELDDIAFFERNITQEEITALYSGTTASPLASTKVYVDAPATVNENENVELSISSEALNSSDNVIAFQTDLAYDSSRYTFVSNNLTGTLNPAGNVVVNSSKNGKLNISYMTQTALNGAGSLVKLKFKANKNLGQGIFSLSDFLFNTTAVTSLKSDTVNTLDVTPPSARINYSQNPTRKGDSLLITVNFNEKMAVSPVPQLNLTGQNTLANTNLTKVNDTTYTYWWVVEKGNGAVNVNLATGKDLGGNGIVATPTQNPSFTVLPTLFGDIDTNKSVQAYDAALALQYSVGLNPLPTMDPLPWSNWRIAVANVDTVGNVTANDASLILQYSAKLISTFPANAKKRGGDAPTADVTVSKEGNQLVFRTTGTLYGFNVYFKDNFNAFGQPEISDKNAIMATNINATTYNLGLASTKPITVNEPFLIIPILTNTEVTGTMDIVANTQEKSLAYGAALSILETNKEMLIVFPNPTKDIVTIKNAQGNTLRILNVEGKEVYNQKMTGNTLDVSLKTLGAKGMYILHIQDTNNESIQSKQIILE